LQATSTSTVVAVTPTQEEKVEEETLLGATLETASNEPKILNHCTAADLRNPASVVPLSILRNPSTDEETDLIVQQELDAEGHEEENNEGATSVVTDDESIPSDAGGNKEVSTTLIRAASTNDRTSLPVTTPAQHDGGGGAIAPNTNMIDEQDTETTTQRSDATSLRWAKLRSAAWDITAHNDAMEELAMEASIREARGNDARTSLFQIFLQNMKSMQSVLAVYFATEDGAKLTTTERITVLWCKWHGLQLSAAVLFMVESGQSAQSAVLDFHDDDTGRFTAIIWWLPFAVFSNVLGTLVALGIRSVFTHVNSGLNTLHQYELRSFRDLGPVLAQRIASTATLLGEGGDGHSAETSIRMLVFELHALRQYLQRNLSEHTGVFNEALVRKLIKKGKAALGRSTTKISVVPTEASMENATRSRRHTRSLSVKAQHVHDTALEVIEWVNEQLELLNRRLATHVVAREGQNEAEINAIVASGGERREAVAMLKKRFDDEMSKVIVLSLNRRQRLTLEHDVKVMKSIRSRLGRAVFKKFVMTRVGKLPSLDAHRHRLMAYAMAFCWLFFTQAYVVFFSAYLVSQQESSSSSLDFAQNAPHYDELPNLWMISTLQTFVFGNVFTGPVIVLFISALHWVGRRHLGGIANLAENN
jgi:hypothetical protein